ncbi:MAG: squalene synthase HpnC [Burkholderiaceae bacterium]|nr:squalene synthase HpnC [Burkholderiaceae bacterium]
MGAGHYENFPVASRLLPAHLRAPVRAIYRFARTADDIADEGDDAPQVRLAKLAHLADQLDAIEAGRSNDWPDLADAVARHALPVALLRDLLSAFAQDVVVQRYADYGELLDYCRRSANPIGRLLLHLYRRDDPALAEQSDSICTALQLTNFWQDVALDFTKGRVYLPAEELRRFGVGVDAIAAGRVDAGWSALMAAQTARARSMLESGAPLARALGGRIGFELRLVVQGGLRILERIDAVAGDLFGRRPVLRAADWLRMTLRAALM